MKYVSKSESTINYDSSYTMFHSLLIVSICSKCLSLSFLRTLLSIWEQSECLDHILN